MLIDWLQPLTQYAPNRTTYKETPAINLYRNQEQARIDVQLPGFIAKEIDLTAEGDLITIRSQAEEKTDEGQLLRSERQFQSFERRIKLPFQIDESQVEAQFNNGILSVNLHMHENEKPRVIPVKSV